MHKTNFLIQNESRHVND